MDECAEHCIGQLVAEFIGRCLITSVILFIDKHVVERRDLIIRSGRKVQNRLAIPQCLRVFADTDPGMLDSQIREATFALFYAGIMANLGLLLAVLVLTDNIPGSTKGFPVLIFLLMAVVPLCIVIVLWIVLAQSRRRLERLPRLPPGYGITKQESHEANGNSDSDGTAPRTFQSIFLSLSSL
ncbi:hypothetical protein QBC44DRAFT_386463 [Cladorrhinum sp. PSN332]|nr:hypothetical protein QBC44DRAFT_386463 [Cladorrhinum sp. PSN332]